MTIFEFFMNNLSTVIVSVVLICVVLLVIYLMHRDKKRSGGCGCGCAECPMKNRCGSAGSASCGTGNCSNKQDGTGTDGDK